MVRAETWTICPRPNPDGHDDYAVGPVGGASVCVSYGKANALQIAYEHNGYTAALEALESVGILLVAGMTTEALGVVVSALAAAKGGAA